MKNLLFIGTALLASMAAANAQTFSITQNNDQDTIKPLNSVACPTEDDQYFRRFDLNGDHGINASTNICRVNFAVESATGITLTVNLHAIANGDSLLMSHLVPIGTATLDVSDTDNLSRVFVPVEGMIDGGLDDLVVEIVAPDSTSGATFFIGSNDAGQTAPSYLRGPDCSASEPTDISLLGFPEMHIVMSVMGTDAVSCDFIFDDGFEGMAP